MSCKKQLNINAYFSKDGSKRSKVAVEDRKRKRETTSEDEGSYSKDVKKPKAETKKTSILGEKKLDNKDTNTMNKDLLDEKTVSETVDLEIQQAKVEENQAKQEQEATEAAIHAIAEGKNLTDVVTKKGSPITYATLCNTFEKCENTTKRLEITEHMVSLFSSVIKNNKEELLSTVYMSINKLCPDYEGLELGIGESLLIKAIAESTGRSVKQIKINYIKSGDLGTIAKDSKGSQRTLSQPKPLTVSHVFKVLKEVAKISGNSAQAKKVGKIKSLLVACQQNEAKYIIRQLEGKLRIGLAEQTVISALAQAALLSKLEDMDIAVAKKEEKLTHAVETLKYVYNQLPCYDDIIPTLLKYPFEELLGHCSMHPGVPLKPMLAHPTKSLTDVLDRFENQTFTCEFKYDGERAQIHKLSNGTINVYSRNSENMSGRYPDVMNAIQKWLKPTTESFILDCEAVAWDKEAKKILPFQVLSTRKRKDVKEEDIKVQVAIYAFDCLYLNGKSLLQESLESRREKLKEAFMETENEFYFAKSMESNNIEDIQTFLDVSVNSNCEGLMVKSYGSKEATYEPSKRSRNWLKVKKDYLNGLGDSMDLVVIGAYHGRGKRTSVYGAFLLACYDAESEQYQTICKIGTGFSDENLQLFYNTLKDHVVPKPNTYYCLGENPPKPDIWFDPVQVWEVKCADLSLSPTYMAAVGKVDEAKGISLRFPRFIRVRDDKDAEDATGSEQVSEFYYAQAQQSGNKQENMDY
ncbi:ATP-dependent DNA ligase [Sporodiniella umbellata]|nr:ATP-dependent DNA ligase [Sporodiniella umbellata]